MTCEVRHVGVARHRYRLPDRVGDLRLTEGRARSAGGGLGYPPGRRQRGVQERLYDITDGGRNAGVVVVHAARHPGAVIDEVELASEVCSIGGAYLLSEIGAALHPARRRRD